MSTLRALGRRALRRGATAPPPPAAPYGYDSWLTALHDDVLAPLDAACAEGAPLTARYLQESTLMADVRDARATRTSSRRTRSTPSTRSTPAAR